ncbi:PX domain-containing protein kinase-like protein, partial [Trichonephila clavata]
RTKVPWSSTSYRSPAFLFQPKQRFSLLEEVSAEYSAPMSWQDKGAVPSFCCPGRPAETERFLQTFQPEVLPNRWKRFWMVMTENNKVLTETSLQHVSMVFRSEPEWEIVEPLLDFGWRIRKQYFSIKSKSDTKRKYVLSWMALGPDQHLNEKDLTSAVKLLGSLQHPYIQPVSMSCVSSNGGLVIYDYSESGTLRDILCNTKPRLPFLKKYGNPKSHNAFELSKIRVFGHQILIALKFLHDRGFYHGSIHSGNAVISGGKCKILDIFNGIQGVPCLLRPYFIQIKKIQTVENIDVYCFGHLLYEMTFGAPLFATTCDNLPNSCAPELRSVILSILSKEALRNGVPSISDLLQHPFFGHAAGEVEKVHFKVPTQLKESLKKMRELIEARLKEEQKSIRHSKRISKVQAQLSSEDEKKKRSHERRKKHNLEVSSNASGERSETSTPTGVSSNTNGDLPASTPIPPPPLPCLLGTLMLPTVPLLRPPCQLLFQILQVGAEQLF